MCKVNIWYCIFRYFYFIVFHSQASINQLSSSHQLIAMQYLLVEGFSPFPGEKYQVPLRTVKIMHLLFIHIYAMSSAMPLSLTYMLLIIGEGTPHLVSIAPNPRRQ